MVFTIPPLPDKTGYTLKNVVMRLNGIDRTDETQNIKYFNYVQPYLYFNHSPTDGLYVYSFAINPMEHQPSSTCNMSRIEDLYLAMLFSEEFTIAAKQYFDQYQSQIYLGVYVVSYNILRIMSGMGGLAFQTSA
jgi:hypothetical protein